MTRSGLLRKRNGQHRDYRIQSLLVNVLSKRPNCPYVSTQDRPSQQLVSFVLKRKHGSEGKEDQEGEGGAQPVSVRIMNDLAYGHIEFRLKR